MLNVTGAFDNVSHFRLIHNLQKKRLDPQIVAWIASFMKDCATTVETNKCLTDLINIDTRIP